MCGYIYKITNNINGKSYIGQTKRTVNIRWQEHLKSSLYAYRTDYSYPLHSAIRKYGKTNFSLETIEIVPVELLDEREIWWIKYYDSHNSGYNITLGGQGNQRYDYDKIFDFWQSGLSCKQIIDELNISYTTLAQVLEFYGVDEKQRIDRQFDVKIGASKKEILEDFLNNKMSINQISKKYSISYKWIKRTLISLGVTEEQIVNNSINGHKTSGKKCPIEQYDKNKNFIQVFPSISDAKRYLGKDYTNTAMNRKLKHDGQFHSYDGYYWRYLK